MRQWRFIYDQPADGAYNMAVDDAILDFVAAGEVPPTLRIYAWSPPSLSLGYGQNETDADLGRIAAHGWGIVRRPTGGRAILHTDELTYSLALPLNHPIAAGGIIESYQRISWALMAALEFLGLQPRSDRADDLPKNPGAVCFEVPSHYEITVDGRKLIGSAQVRRRGGILQHGSLPLSGDLARICDALAYPDEQSRELAREKVRSHAITLSEALGREIDYEIAAEALFEGFRTVFDVEFLDDFNQLTSAEQVHADLLMTERYSTLNRTRARV